MGAYRKGSLSWGEYVRFLSRYTDDFSPKVETFLAALELEQKVDFALAQSNMSERIFPSTPLVAKLNKAETDDLFNQSAAYRMGGLSHSDFYSYLKELCAKKDLSLVRYPAMDQYILSCVLLSDGLDVDAIQKKKSEEEQKNHRRREERVYASLATTGRRTTDLIENPSLFSYRETFGFRADERRMGRLLSS